MSLYLLADIGGTNARFALARDGVLDPASIAHLRNGDHSTFDAALLAYLVQVDFVGITTACVAIAGPVADGKGRLTNRDWSVSAEGIKQVVGCGNVTVINDLYAFGRALTGLGSADVIEAVAAHPNGNGNGQLLAVNIGTGFNVTFVMTGVQGDVCSLAEAGHSSLPISIAARLRALIGTTAADDFATVEHCFSGRGLAHVHAAATGGPVLRGEDILAMAEQGGPEHAAHRMMTGYAEMLGILLHELNLLFLPSSGIYLVGSVARGIMQSGFGAQVCRSFADARSDAVSVPRPPLSLITSDNAGLIGCLAVLNG